MIQGQSSIHESVNRVENSSESHRGRGRGRGRGYSQGRQQNCGNGQNGCELILEDLFLLSNNTKNDNKIILDSGATRTMIGQRLSSLVTSQEKLAIPVKITFPNGSTTITDCGGTLKFKTPIENGKINLSFQNALVTNALKHSVISVAQICDAGALVIFTKNDGKIVRKDKNGKNYEVASFPQIRNLYQLVPNNSTPKTTVLKWWKKFHQLT